MSETQFEGFDWLELYEPLLGKPLPEDFTINEEGDLAEEIREKLNSVACVFEEEEIMELARVANLCRKFLKACAADEMACAEKPFFEGLAAIKYDENLVRLMDPVLEYLWT
jgi:hypothetical protein